MRPLPVCLYLVGAPPDPIRSAFGDFEPWFRRLLVAGRPLEVTVWDGIGTALPPDPRKFAGIAISGSPASLAAPEPWMESGVELVREAAQVGTPLLGVCFGHQLIGAAYCGSVIENPEGWELSTYDIEVTESGRRDPLFAGLPETIQVNLSHRDVVDTETLSPHNGVTVLARSARVGAQAIAAGDSIRGVQFHPEFTGPVTRAYVDLRRDALAADAERREAPHDHPDHLEARAQDSPHGEQVFANWIEHFVCKA